VNDPLRSTGRSRFIDAIVVFFVYVTATIAFTWPLAISIGTRLGAPEGPGDPYLNLWILGWDLRVLTTRPLALVDGTIFNANIFHPAVATLAYSDHLLPQAIALLPLHAATHDVVICYNALLLVSFLASGLTMHALARGLGSSHTGAAIAGFAWAFWPYRMSHLIHLQLQALYFLPLVLLSAHRLVAGARRRDAVSLGVFTALQTLSSLYYGVMAVLAIAVSVIGLGVSTSRLRSTRLLSRLALAAMVGAVVVAPIVWPYWRIQRDEGFARNLYEASRHAAVVRSYAQVPETNWLYGRTHVLTFRDAAGREVSGRLEGVEQSLFPGGMLLLLALVGFLSTRRHATWPVAWTMLALAALAAVLSLGPDGIRPVYATFHQYVFGFQAVRAPSRFAVLVMLALGLLAALGATRLETAKGIGVWAVRIALIALCVEYATMPLSLVDRPPKTTAVGQWLASQRAEGAVLYLPLTNDRRNTLGMVDSLQHGRPILNGYSGQRPSFYPALVDVLSTFPSADALWTLRDFGVRFVVAPSLLPESVSPEAAARGVIGTAGTPLFARARFESTVVYEVVWTPEVEARLAPPAPPPPPPPGRAPFIAPERLEYAVKWIGGPVDLAAGKITLEVEKGRSTDVAYRFIATAETAPWMARFFEARDRFETEAGVDLLPRTHRRSLREGRRSLDRVYRFDALSGVVRIGPPDSPEPPVPFRIPAATRDALTMLFYVRTQALANGEEITAPVNDGGRNLIVQIKVVRREPVTLEGRRIDAIRLEPTIVERVPRRDPIQSTVWISDDRRKIVVAVDIAAGFGRLRLELVP
jgi:Protein of unknown function (DUF3108)